MADFGSQNDRGRDTPGPPGIGETAAGILGSILDYLDTRYRLFQLEAVETRGAIVRRLIALVVGALFLIIAYVGIAVGTVGLLASVLDKPWHLVALVAAGLHALAGVGFLLFARQQFRSPPFRDTRKELEKDRQWINELRPRP